MVFTVLMRESICLILLSQFETETDFLEQLAVLIKADKSTWVAKCGLNKALTVRSEITSGISVGRLWLRLCPFPDSWPLLLSTCPRVIIFHFWFH